MSNSTGSGQWFTDDQRQNWADFKDIFWFSVEAAGLLYSVWNRAAVFKFLTDYANNNRERTTVQRVADMANTDEGNMLMRFYAKILRKRGKTTQADNVRNAAADPPDPDGGAATSGRESSGNDEGPSRRHPRPQDDLGESGYPMTSRRERR